jgi:membrane associated rhomboid family serine protease
MVPDNHLEFLHAVATRRTLYTFIFLGLNIFIFLLMALAGGSTNESTLMAFGVKANAAIERGQWWRFITPIFIHIGLLHLIFNSYALWMIGPQVERLYGPARFVTLYVMTGIAGVYGSYFYHPESISAGASGAIFGLFGVLLVFGIRYRESIPPSFARAVGTGVLPVIVINLIIGFTIPGIDNSAHLSGLAAGAALAALVPFHRPGTETPSIFKSVQMLLLATILVCFYSVAKNYDGPRLSVRNLSRSFTQVMGTRSLTQDFVQAINTTEQAFHSSIQDLESGRTGSLDSHKKETAGSIDRLRKVPSMDPEADELTRTLLRVMQDQYALIEDVQRAGTITFAHGQQLKENIRAYEIAMSQLSEWVKTNGRRHGITESNR